MTFKLRLEGWEGACHSNERKRLESGSIPGREIPKYKGSKVRKIWWGELSRS